MISHDDKSCYDHLKHLRVSMVSILLEFCLALVVDVSIRYITPPPPWAVVGAIYGCNSALLEIKCIRGHVYGSKLSR